jgi:hypothetical protein
MEVQLKEDQELVISSKEDQLEEVVLKWFHRVLPLGIQKMLEELFFQDIPSRKIL